MNNVNTAIKPSLGVIQGKLYATSLEIAEEFGKRHADVLRAIRNLECSPEFAMQNFFISEYTLTNNLGFKVKKPMYRLTRDGHMFLVMGFTGRKAMRFKIGCIERFDALVQKTGHHDLFNDFFGDLFDTPDSEHVTAAE